MNTYADKTQEKKSQSVASKVDQKQSGGESTFQFVDKRPEAIAQRKMQEMANNSSTIQRLRAFQAMANSSPQAKQATQLQAIVNNNSAQQLQPNVQRRKITASPFPIQREVTQDGLGWWVTTQGTKFKKKKQADTAEAREVHGIITVNNYHENIQTAGGNYALGSANEAEANKIGANWIGKALYGPYNLSKDKKRQYRKPTLKAALGISQANVEERAVTAGAWTSNGHITITP